MVDIVLEMDGEYRRVAKRFDNEKIMIVEEYYNSDKDKWEEFDSNFVRSKDIHNLIGIANT